VTAPTEGVSRRKQAAQTRAKRATPVPRPSVKRAYRVAQHGNTAKIAAVAQVLAPYQATMRSAQRSQWRMWCQDGQQFWNRRDSSLISSTLSERYKRSAQNQVVAGLDSWLELTKDAVARTVTRSSLDAKTKADLHWLNRSCMHHRTDGTAMVPVWVYDDDGVRTPGKDRRPASPETLFLLRRITKHVRRHRVSVPTLWRTRTMTLDGTVAQLETSTPKPLPQPSPRRRSPGSTFGHWLRISTLTPGETVRIPLASNRYLDAAAGGLSNFAQVAVARDDTVKITLVKCSDPAPERTGGIEVGLDWGLHSMFASSLGDQLGTALYPWLVRLDTQLTALAADLQRQGIKLARNTRYRNFQRRIRGYVRNEVGRVVNRLLEIYDIRSITVEDLDFRDGGMSKRMNRILTRAGRAAVKEKLAAITETHGVTIHAVHPAHTSRECSGCHYVDPRNRQGQHFRCRFCHKRLNADTNGSRVLLRRRSVHEADTHLGRKTVLRKADARFEAHWGLRPGRAEKLRSRPTERPAPPRPKTDGLVQRATCALAK